MRLDSSFAAFHEKPFEPFMSEGFDHEIEARGLKVADFLFSSRLHTSPHLSTRQYSRLVHRWIASIGLDDTASGTHTMRRTKASLIYRRTKNLRAEQTEV